MPERNGNALASKQIALTAQMIPTFNEEAGI